jgi:hypothetical protein
MRTLRLRWWLFCVDVVAVFASGSRLWLWCICRASDATDWEEP